MIKTSDMGLFQYQEFEKFLPKPRMEGMNDDLLGARAVINISVVDLLHMDDSYHEEMIKHYWNNLYEDVVRRIAARISGRSDYFVTRLIPRMREDGYVGGIILELLVECFVAKTKNVYIPEIIYEKVGVERTRVIEWRCGYCGSPNKMEDRHCTQCGSPRALLIQEMR